MKKSSKMFANHLSGRLVAASLVAAFTLNGCATTYQQNLPQFKSVKINERIEFPVDRTRVFIQDGKIVRGFDHYKANCNLEIRTKDSNSVQYVEPGEYTVTSIRETMQHVVRFDMDRKVHLAGVGLGVSFGNIHFASGGFSGSPSDIYRGYHFNVSGDDANVMRVSCRGVYEHPSLAELPTEAEMMLALGNIITINK